MNIKGADMQYTASMCIKPCKSNKRIMVYILVSLKQTIFSVFTENFAHLEFSQLTLEIIFRKH